MLSYTTSRPDELTIALLRSVRTLGGKALETVKRRDERPIVQREDAL